MVLQEGVLPIRRTLSGLSIAVALLLIAVPAETSTTEDSTEAERLYREGSLALRGGEPERAARTLERLLELEPQHVKGLLTLGMARSALKQWAQAIAAYERLLSLEPSHARALNNLGNVHYRQGDYPTAAEYYGKALEADPQYAKAAYLLGRVSFELNRPEPAAQAIAHCLSLEADDDAARRTRVDCRFYQGALEFRARNHAAAAAIMEEIVRIFPSHPEARYYLGMSYRHLGRLEEAREQLAIHQAIMQRMQPDQPIEKRQEP